MSNLGTALSGLSKPVEKAEKSEKHPGFKAVQSKVASKEGISKKKAGAIIASSTRKASSAAKMANPALKKVK